LSKLSMEPTLTTSSLIESSKFVANDKIDQQTISSSSSNELSATSSFNRTNTDSANFFSSMRKSNEHIHDTVLNELKSSNHASKSLKEELDKSSRLENSELKSERRSEPILLSLTSTHVDQLKFIDLSATSLNEKLNENNEMGVYQTTAPLESKVNKKKTSKKVRSLLSNRCYPESLDSQPKKSSLSLGNKKCLKTLKSQKKNEPDTQNAYNPNISIPSPTESFSNSSMFKYFSFSYHFIMSFTVLDAHFFLIKFSVTFLISSLSFFF